LATLGSSQKKLIKGIYFSKLIIQANLIF